MTTNRESRLSSSITQGADISEHVPIGSHTQSKKKGRIVMRKVDPPYLVPPDSNISKYLGPRIIYFNFAEIFGSPGTKISEFGPP